MEHYDRIRTTVLSAEDAMREAAPFFARDPNVRTGHPATTLALTEGTSPRWAANEHGPHRSEWDEQRQRQRAQQLIAGIRADCKDRQLPEPTHAELRTALEITTNLPGRIITSALHDPGDLDQHSEAIREERADRSRTAHLTGAVDDLGTTNLDERTRPLSEAQRDTAIADAAKARSGPRPPHEVAADDLPYAIGEAMRLAAERPPQPPAPRKPRRPGPEQPRRRR